MELPNDGLHEQAAAEPQDPHPRLAEDAVAVVLEIPAGAWAAAGAGAQGNAREEAVRADGDCEVREGLQGGQRCGARAGWWQRAGWWRRYADRHKRLFEGVWVVHKAAQ